MTTREQRNWKADMIPYLTIMKTYYKDSKASRHDRDYATYLKRFFFGDAEIMDFASETWNIRLNTMDRPLPRNIYLFS